MSSALVKAVAHARALATARDSRELRDVLEHAHEMYESLIEGLLDNRVLITPDLCSVARDTGEAIADLDARVADSRGNVQMIRSVSPEHLSGYILAGIAAAEGAWVVYIASIDPRRFIEYLGREPQRDRGRVTGGWRLPSWQWPSC